jgi:hypothetical protein
VIVYVRVEVGLHGLNEYTVDGVTERIRKALEREFDTSLDSDVEIEVVEHAGQEASET